MLCAFTTTLVSSRLNIDWFLLEFKSEQILTLSLGHQNTDINCVKLKACWPILAHHVISYGPPELHMSIVVKRSVHICTSINNLINRHTNTCTHSAISVCLQLSSEVSGG